MFYSLKSRLIAVFVLLLVVSFGTMSYLLFNESRATIRSYIESSALEKMDEYGSFINMAVNHIYDVASMAFNSEVTKSWNTAVSDPALPAGERILTEIALSQFLTKTTNSYSSVSSVTIYQQDGTWVSSDNQVVSDRSFLDASWYKDFKARGNHWVSAHTDPVEARSLKPFQVVSLLLPVSTFEPSSSKSVMKINVSADFLLEPLSRIHLGENGTIFLLDGDGHLILPQKQYYSNPAAMRKVEEIRSNRLKQGVEYMKNEHGANDILVYKKLQPNNWMLVCFVSEDDLYSKLFKLRTSIVVFTTLLLVVAILLAMWLSYGITKPLSRLVSAMRSVQKGDFTLAENRIPPERSVRNEVGFVTATFRNMVQQLRHHIKTEFELKLLRQQAEYKALLMQINPHFLFNTLELLSSLAIQRRTDDTVLVIESLGKMLRFSLKISDDLVSLEEEMKYLRHYLSILKIRFGDRLVLIVEEEEGAHTAQVVKFILQPLVENAVKYSFLQQPVAEVSISVRRERGQIRLTVADNGPGMDREFIERLAQESASTRLDQILNSDDRQIGLRNVLARCQLYYGSRFTFLIESEVGGGTLIQLILPALEGTNDDVSSIDRR